MKAELAASKEESKGPKKNKFYPPAEDVDEGEPEADTKESKHINI